MMCSVGREIYPIVSALILFFLLLTPVFPKIDRKEFGHANQTFGSDKRKLIKATLTKINKPFVKSIKSSDGDIIDCVPIHLQPAFDNPMLKGTMPLIPPEIPNGYKNEEGESNVKQLWSSNGESCPEGTIPIRRTTESDTLRSNSISKIRMKISNTDSSYPGYERAVAYVIDGEYYGAKATLNVWAPNVARIDDISFSQIWVIAEVPTHAVSTFEAGWMVAPKIYNNSHLPRLFIYWTNDGYRSGCYNLRCEGFIQTNPKICLGAALAPISTYNGGQRVIRILIWKDPRQGNWWLRVGNNTVGYWPVGLFPDFKEHATTITYGGEVYSDPTAELPHTSTQMGSGHFSSEGFGKAAYIKHMEFVDQNNTLNSVQHVDLIVDRETCYDARNGEDSIRGNYILFGGPGYNPNCT